MMITDLFNDAQLRFYIEPRNMTVYKKIWSDLFYHPTSCLDELKEALKEVNQICQPQAKNLKAAPSEYKAGIQSTQWWRHPN
jgi:hypothetical protein